MKRLSCRRAASLLLACVMLLLCCPCAYAHPASKEGIVWGGESVGWDINEDKHTNGTTLTYAYDTDDSYLTATYKTYIVYGADRWSSTVNIVRKTDGTEKGTVTTVYVSGNDTTATFWGSVNSSGHLTKWKISLNRYYNDNIDSKLLAHEFGHAIGLNDLYKSSNANKIMYGYSGSSWTATGVTSADRWGAKVITGDHTSHSMSYKYSKTDSAGNNYHVKYCTDCGGLASSAVKCTYNSNNCCKLCGTPKGAQTSSLAYLMK